MSINTLIFDLDGTLVDTMPALADKAAELIRDHYGMNINEAKHQCLKTAERPFKEQLETFFPKHLYNKKVASIYEQWKKNYQKFYAKPQPEILLLLKHLKKNDFKIGVSSNDYQDNVSIICEYLPVDAALGLRDDAFCKGKAHFDWFTQQFHIDKSELLFVGDTLNDAKIAKDCEVHFAGLTHLFAEHEFIAISDQCKPIESLVHLKDQTFLESF